MLQHVKAAPLLLPQEAQEQRKQGPERGIIINAGGRKLLSSAVILMKVGAQSAK